MTRRELIAKAHEGIAEAGLSQRQIAEVIDRVFGAIAETLRDEGTFTHPGFGTFTVKIKNARVGRNPRTGEAIELAEGTTVGFKPSRELKALLKR